MLASTGSTSISCRIIVGVRFTNSRGLTRWVSVRVEGSNSSAAFSMQRRGPALSIKTLYDEGEKVRVGAVVLPV
jgi:hypothetical protein